MITLFKHKKPVQKDFEKVNKKLKSNNALLTKRVIDLEKRLKKVEKK